MNPLDDIKDIIRGALASLGGFGGRMIARLALMVTAGQLYGAISLGILGQVAAITEILAAVAVIGLKRSLLQFLSEQSDSNAKVLSTVKEAVISSVLIAGGLSLVFAGAWSFMFPDITMPVALYFAVPAVAFAEVAGTAIRFKRIIRWEVVARCIMEPWTFLLAALTCYYIFNNTETGLIAAYALSCVAAAGGIILGLHHAYGLGAIMTVPINVKNLYIIPRRSWQAGITDIGIMMFRRLDILILSLLAGHNITGAYYMAQQIVTVPHKIHKLFEPMTAPVIAKLHQAKKPRMIEKKLSGICRWIFTIQLALTVPFAMFAGQLLGLFNEAFAASAVVLVILLVAELVDGSFALTETPLIYARPSKPPKLIAFTLMVELISVAAFAYFWEAAGAAIGFMIAMITLNTMRLVNLRKYMSISVITLRYFVPLLFGLITAVTIFVIKNTIDMSNYGAAISIVSTISLYALMARFWALSKDDKLVLSELKAQKAVSKQVKLS